MAGEYPSDFPQADVQLLIHGLDGTEPPSPNLLRAGWWTMGFVLGQVFPATPLKTHTHQPKLTQQQACAHLQALVDAHTKKQALPNLPWEQLAAVIFAFIQTLLHIIIPSPTPTPPATSKP